MALETTSHINEYLQIFKDFGPLAVLAAGITFALGFHYVKRSYLQRTPLSTLGNLLFSALMAALLVICVLCLSEWLLPPLSAKLELGIAVFVGIFGVKGIDYYLRRKWKLSIVDLMNPQDINEIRLKMPQEARRKHLEQCPFKGDGVEGDACTTDGTGCSCDKCPYRQEDKVHDKGETRRA